ncbi:MAG: DUF2796 domain-containing protein [Gammaproteobacteria bacterium]|nr:DUF2796 domain-containing protein [Gammaproteobacteria bacterium]
MQISRLMKIITLILFFTSQAVYADTIQEPVSDLDAHVHGLSELTLAIEGNMLEIQLKSPAMNLLGFEHKAHSKDDIASVENVLLQLSEAELLFSFSDGHCALTDSDIDVSSVLDSDDTHGHEAEHHDHENEDNHSDIIAHYHYNCESVANLSSITVALFDVFPGIEKIQAQWITEKQQGGQTLSTEKRIISLR